MSDLVIAVQEKIEDNEHIVSYEKALWPIMFTILSIYLPIYSILNVISPIIVFTVQSVLLLTLLFLFRQSIKEGRKKLKAKSFYRMVYNILTQPDAMKKVDSANLRGKEILLDNDNEKHYGVRLRKIQR